MKLSERLKAITNFVEDNSNIIDIGCDHALLDIFLYENFNNINIIASDIHVGAVKQAKKNIEKYDLDGKIDLRLGDGLDVIEQGEVDTIIISGMGFYTISEILTNPEKIEGIDKIIIQSNTDIVKLRKFVIKLGFKISNELLVKDKDIIYTVIKFVRGREKYSYDEIYFGPRILENKDELFYEYYNKKLLKYENLLLQLPKTQIVSRIHHMNLIRIIKRQVKDNKITE